MLTNIVAAVLLLEAGSEGPEGMNAVHTVILNRAALTHKTEKEIVLSPFQFSCCNGPSPGEILLLAFNEKKWPLLLQQQAQAIAQSKVRTARISECLFYCNVRCKPKWIKEKTFVSQIGQHRFYK